MTAVINAAFKAFSTAVAAITPATDSGSPAQYKCLGSLENLLATPGDRLFTVELGQPPVVITMGTGVPGGNIVGNGELVVAVAFRHRNEGAAQVDFGAILAEELWRIAVRVRAYFCGGAVSGVEECVLLGTTWERAQGSAIYFSTLTFKVSFTDTLPSS